MLRQEVLLKLTTFCKNLLLAWRSRYLNLTCHIYVHVPSQNQQCIYNSTICLFMYSKLNWVLMVKVPKVKTHRAAQHVPR